MIATPNDRFRGSAPVQVGWQSRPRRDIAGRVTLIVGVLIVVTTAALSGFVYLMYPPGSAVPVSVSVERFLVVPLAVGVVVFLVGLAAVVLQRRRPPPRR